MNQFKFVIYDTQCNGLIDVQNFFRFRFLGVSGVDRNIFVIFQAKCKENNTSI